MRSLTSKKSFLLSLLNLFWVFFLSLSSFFFYPFLFGFLSLLPFFFGQIPPSHDLKERECCEIFILVNFKKYFFFWKREYKISFAHTKFLLFFEISILKFSRQILNLSSDFFNLNKLSLSSLLLFLFSVFLLLFSCLSLFLLLPPANR